MNLLVVDDNPSMNRFLMTYLSENGHQVAALTEGSKVMSWLDLNSCDAVIMDIGMPDVDGLELVAAVRAQHPDLPVIMFTGMGYDENAMQAARKAGASGYVSKGAGAREIQLALTRIMATHRRGFSKV